VAAGSETANSCSASVDRLDLAGLSTGSARSDGKRRTTKRKTANGERRTEDCDRRTATAELQNSQVRTDRPNLEDLERIDALINEFFPIALSEEEDFARAIKAAYLVLEVIDIHAQLLLSVARDLCEFSFFP
jgi:hypothetical protein